LGEWDEPAGSGDWDATDFAETADTHHALAVAVYSAMQQMFRESVLSYAKSQVVGIKRLCSTGLPLGYCLIG